jgi:acyl carrier protein
MGLFSRCLKRSLLIITSGGNHLSENERKLRGAFARGLNQPETAINESLTYENSPGWDSIAHMALVAALDETFDIMLETEDVIDMSSYLKAREILAKYGIKF